MLKQLLQFFTKTKIVIVDRELILLETINSLTRQLDKLQTENTELRSKSYVKSIEAAPTPKAIQGVLTWDDEKFQLERDSRDRVRRKMNEL